MATVESEIARLIAAKTTEDNDKLFASQERMIASPAETLRGCAAKLRVIFDPRNGPCPANIEAREFAAVAQIVEVIEPPVEGVTSTVVTLRLSESGVRVFGSTPKAAPHNMAGQAVCLSGFRRPM